MPAAIHRNPQCPDLKVGALSFREKAYPTVTWREAQFPGETPPHSVLLVEQHVSFALTAAAGYAVMASGYLTASGTGGTEAVGSVMAAMTI